MFFIFLPQSHIPSKYEKRLPVVCAFGRFRTDFPQKKQPENNSKGFRCKDAKVKSKLIDNRKNNWKPIQSQNTYQEINVKGKRKKTREQRKAHQKSENKITFPR
jgi:hypothetical protein